MKVTLRGVLIGIILLSTGCLYSQTRHFTFDNSAKKDGFQIEKSTRSNLKVRHAVKQMDLRTIQDNGYIGEQIETSGIFLPANAGTPNLPAESKFIAIPNGSTVQVNISRSNVQTISNVDLLAAAPILSDTDNTPTTYEKDQSIYSVDAFYPSNPVSISEVLDFRGVQVVALTVIPYQYNPVTKELRVFHDLDINISFDGGNGTFGEERLRSRYFDEILENALLNYNQIPSIDYEARVRNHTGRETGCEYLIVIPNDEAFRQYANQIASYRIKQGISTQVKSLSEMGCTSTNDMKNYFHNAYATWDTPPVAVLLFGDHSTNMSTGIPAETISHPSEGTCITDNQYADCTGDYLPDICFSRLVAANATEAQMMASKVLEYEYTAPNMNASSYQNPITALGWQTERWFQICSEVVGGYWRQHGKTPVRINAIYSGSPGNSWSSNANTYLVTNYFGPNGRGYLPATPSELGGWTGGTANQVVTAVNNGAFLLQHRDHGYTQGWGEPSFSTSNVNQMNNVGKMTFVMSINCQTGNFSAGGNCLGEAFIRRTYNNQNAGAVGVLCPTQTSYSFVNDTYVWGVFDLFDPQFMPDYGPYADYSSNWMPAFGNVAGKYFLAQSSWPYNPNEKRITIQMFTAHCDAFLRLYTQVPQNLNVTHAPEIDSDDDSFQITAPAGSVIALTVGNTILAVADATGSTQMINFAPQETGTVVHIVVTKQDYLRYEDDITVTNSTPNLNVIQAVVHDNNNNGQLDYGEESSFNLTIRNDGGIPSGTTTATLSCSSEYITILENQTSFPGLNPNQSTTLNDVFNVRASNSVPDNTEIAFMVHMVSGDFSWDKRFNIVARAPFFKILETYTIDDSNGNGNGRLDAGETVNIQFNYTNQGGSTAGSTNAILTSSSSYLNISNATSTVQNVNAGQTIQPSYQVTVDNGTPAGQNVNLILNVASGAYSDNHSFAHRIGLEVENWESGDLNAFEWENDSDHPWTITSTQPYQGQYCLQSGTIPDNGHSILSINYNVEQADVISFFKKTSTQQNHDKLIFYIDGNIKGYWSGTNAWSEFSTDVTAGEHTFTWEYYKDASSTAGQDRVWIDYILFPIRHIDFICLAGADMTVCNGNSAQLQATAAGYETIAWTTSGDGSFNNTNILNPTYTPGNEDINNGEVTLTLTITNEAGNTLTDNVVVTINPNASITLISETSICYNDSFLTNANVANFSNVTWTSNGDGLFNDPNAIQTIYTPGTQDIANGNATLTLSATSAFGCEDASADVLLDILPSAIITLSENVEVCANENYLSDAIVTGQSAVIWSSNGDGNFNDINAINSVYSFGTQDIINGNVTLTLTAETENGCEPLTKQVNISILPSAFISMESEAVVCNGEPFQAEATVINATSMLWTTDGDGYFEDASLANATYLPGNQDIENGQVSLTLTAESETSSCNAATSSVVLIINPTPTIEIANTNIVFCADQPTIDVAFNIAGYPPYQIWFEEINEPFDVDENGVIAIQAFNESTSLHLISAVSNGCTSTLDLTINFIKEEIPFISGTPTGADEIDVYFTPTSSYQVNAVENANNYVWTIVPETAGNLTPNNNEVNVTWSENYKGSASIAVMAENSCGTSEVSEIEVTVKNSTSIEESSSAKVKIYPNPTKDLLNIQVESLKNASITVEIYNILGEKVLSEKSDTNEEGLNIQLSVDQLTQGSYILNILSDGFSTSQKVMIQ